MGVPVARYFHRQTLPEAVISSSQTRCGGKPAGWPSAKPPPAAAPTKQITPSGDSRPRHPPRHTQLIPIATEARPQSIHWRCLARRSLPTSSSPPLAPPRAVAAPPPGRGKPAHALQGQRAACNMRHKQRAASHVGRLSRPRGFERAAQSEPGAGSTSDGSPSLSFYSYLEQKLNENHPPPSGRLISAHRPTVSPFQHGTLAAMASRVRLPANRLWLAPGSAVRS
jgi:hypothetical protein